MKQTLFFHEKDDWKIWISKVNNVGAVIKSSEKTNGADLLKKAEIIYLLPINKALYIWNTNTGEKLDIKALKKG